MAALLKDLKRRGLLDSTLVMIGGEFGRSPESQGSKGRDHHNLGFTMLMAGGGIQGGITYGATDEIGLKAIDKPVALPRHPHHDPASAGPQPGRAELPAPGPAGTADPDPGRSDQGNPGVEPPNPCYHSRMVRQGQMLGQGQDAR